MSSLVGRYFVRQFGRDFVKCCVTGPCAEDDSMYWVRIWHSDKPPMWQLRQVSFFADRIFFENETDCEEALSQKLQEASTKADEYAECSEE